MARVGEPPSSATVSGESDSGTIAGTKAATELYGAVGAVGSACRGPTTGAEPVSVTLRIANAPSMPTHKVELSTDSASTSGSEPTGVAAATVAEPGSMAVMVFG